MTGDAFGRRMSFATVFAVLCVATASSALRAGSLFGQVISGWVAADALALSIAYFLNWPGVFGKTKQGNLLWMHALFMAPLLFIIRIVWTLQNRFICSPLYNEIVPGLFVGRLCGHESLPAGITLFVDLTAEFNTPRSIRAKIPFICLPTLDGCAPNWMKCQRAFELIGTKHHRMYVCCANGHGRSVTFTAAWFGTQGICHSADEAIMLIQAARPTAAPNRDQISFLTQAYQILKLNEPR